MSVGALAGFLGGVGGGGMGIGGGETGGGLPQGGAATSTGGNIGGDNKITPEGLRQEGNSGPRGVNITFAKGGAMIDTSQSTKDNMGSGTLGVSKDQLPIAIFALVGLVIGFLIIRKVS